MSINEENVREIEQYLDQVGYTLSDLIKVCGQRKSKLLMLDDVSYLEFKTLYDSIEAGNLDIREKGRKLEELSALIFQKSVSGLFNVYKNCRTSTNEIDLLIEWTENARLANISNAFPCFGAMFLCECKNYKGTVSVTYVGKFYSLMSMTETDLGIMISWDGVSGRGPWNDSLGLIKKIALREKKYIIVIDKDDLKNIYDKKASVFSIVNDKYLALKNEINFEKYISKHNAEETLRKK